MQARPQRARHKWNTQTGRLDAFALNCAGKTGVFSGIFASRASKFPAFAYLDNMAKLIVWFDGSCPLCKREIALMRRLDKETAIQFIDIGEDNANCPLDKAELLARFHAEENGELLSGAAAFAAMWRAIPVLRPLGLAAKNSFILGALERLYMMFLRARPGLQKLMLRYEAAR